MRLVFDRRKLRKCIASLPTPYITRIIELEYAPPRNDIYDLTTDSMRPMGDGLAYPLRMGCLPQRRRTRQRRAA